MCQTHDSGGPIPVPSLFMMHSLLSLARETTDIALLFTLHMLLPKENDGREYLHVKFIPSSVTRQAPRPRKHNNPDL